MKNKQKKTGIFRANAFNQAKTIHQMNFTKCGRKQVLIVSIINFIQSMIKFVRTLCWQHDPENEWNVDDDDDDNDIVTGDDIADCVQERQITSEILLKSYHSCYIQIEKRNYQKLCCKLLKIAENSEKMTLDRNKSSFVFIHVCTVRMLVFSCEKERLVSTLLYSYKLAMNWKYYAYTCIETECNSIAKIWFSFFFLFVTEQFFLQTFITALCDCTMNTAAKY